MSDFNERVNPQQVAPVQRSEEGAEMEEEESAQMKADSSASFAAPTFKATAKESED